jgi:hypothetical protein
MGKRTEQFKALPAWLKVGVVGMSVGAGLTVYGLASTGGGNDEIATKLCHDYLSSHAAVVVAFQPDPIVAHNPGNVITVSGGADVGMAREGYSCDVQLQGDKLQVLHAAFGE